jgi:ribosome maturation factor RimP
MSPAIDVIDAIKQAITPIIEGSGNFLEEVTLLGGSPKTLTVVIDSEAHLNLDQVTIVTKAISDILENLPELGSTPFTLEVTSPGIERPLTLPRHWKKNHGRLVEITLNEGSIIKGRIGELTNTAVTIDGDEVEFSTVNRALIEIEFKSLKAEA